MPSHGFDKNLIQRVSFSTSKGVFCNDGGYFKKKKFYVSRILSNMSKNGLRMVVRLNFDITHLSPPSSEGQKVHHAVLLLQ